MKKESHKEKIRVELEPRILKVGSWSYFNLKSDVKLFLFLFIKLSEQLNYSYTVLLQNVTQPFCTDENKAHAALSYPKSERYDSSLRVIVNFLACSCNKEHLWPLQLEKYLLLRENILPNKRPLICVSPQRLFSQEFLRLWCFSCIITPQVVNHHNTALPTQP